MSEEYEDEGQVIDWENPFDDIRSSEVDSITFKLYPVQF